MNHHLGVLQD